MATNNAANNIKDELSLPEPFASIPRYSLLLGPSPVHPLPRISAALGGKVNIYAKREDLNSSLAFGGNKTRKLEYLVPDALSQSCDTLVSIGGYQSNHTRQVAGVAAKLGLKAKLVQEKWVDRDDPSQDKVGNIQLSRLMNADVRLDSSGFGIEHKETLKRLTDQVIAEGGKPYVNQNYDLSLSHTLFPYPIHHSNQLLLTICHSTSPPAPRTTRSAA